MGKFFKFSATCIAMTFLLGSVSTSALDNSKIGANPDKILDKPIGTIVSSKTDKINNITEQEIVITNRDEISRYAKEKNIESPETIKKIVKTRRINNNNSNSIQNKNNIQQENISALALFYSVKRYGQPVQMVSTTPKYRYDVPGQISFEKEIEGELTSKNNANISLSYKVLNAGLGVDSQFVYRERILYRGTVPKGEDWTFLTYSMWTRYYYEIYNGNAYVDAGSLDVALGFDTDLIVRYI